jgi:hypothetical protein
MYRWVLSQTPHSGKSLPDETEQEFTLWANRDVDAAKRAAGIIHIIYVGGAAVKHCWLCMLSFGPSLSLSVTDHLKLPILRLLLHRALRCVAEHVRWSSRLQLCRKYGTCFRIHGSTCLEQSARSHGKPISRPPEAPVRHHQLGSHRF